MAERSRGVAVGREDKRSKSHSSQRMRHLLFQQVTVGGERKTRQSQAPAKMGHVPDKNWLTMSFLVLNRGYFGGRVISIAQIPAARMYMDAR